MATLNDEIVQFLKTAPISEEDRAKLTARAKVRVNKKLVADIDVALTSAYDKLAEEDPEGNKIIQEIEAETEAGLEDNWREFDKEAKKIEKDEEDAYRTATQEIDQANLEEVKKELSA